MANCTSGCRTQDHDSYGECLRAKAPRDANSTRSVDSLYRKEYVNNLEITEYKKARAQGIQPKGSKLADIREAVALSRRADQALTISR